MHTAIPVPGLPFVGQRTDLTLGHQEINKHIKDLQSHLLSACEMIEEDPWDSSKPTSFQTAGESLVHSPWAAQTSLTPLQGTAWLGRCHYKKTPGLYSTPKRNKRKINLYLAFSKRLCTRECLCPSRAEQLPGALFPPQSVCWHTCGFKQAAKTSQNSVHPSWLFTQPLLKSLLCSCNSGQILVQCLFPKSIHLNTSVSTKKLSMCYFTLCF